jgi:hypothetical protein
MSRDAALGGEIPDAGTEQRPDRGEGVDECGAIVVDADAGEPFEARSRAVVVNTPPRRVFRLECLLRGRRGGNGRG